MVDQHGQREQSGKGAIDGAQSGQDHPQVVPRVQEHRVHRVT